MKNRYSLLLLVASLGVISCQEKVTVATDGGLEAVKDSVIVYEEYMGEEPTTPEETEFYEPKVAVVKSATASNAPSDAVVLFNGTSLNNWISTNDSTAAKWHLNKDGSMTVNDKTGNIQTKQNFGDVQLHIEWKSPLPVQRDNQNRANSGVFLNGIYEVQILDQNDNPTYVNGQVGSIYKQHVPLAMASVPTGEWNTYDIIYHAPEFNVDGGKIKSGDITVIHNGILVQDHVELKGTTPYVGWPKNPAHGKGPLMLQDHGDDSRVSFRNIWVREL
ncbi:DUF1080 domain-containing protein [Maribacter sp. Asnod2-G09]|uniref:3-keto-disaccharide hydrolase n=1 Tax=Maribacter sp. Asnod2-G09 TaxID=3160577 RepID=UPI00386981CA